MFSRQQTYVRRLPAILDRCRSCVLERTSWHRSVSNVKSSLPDEYGTREDGGALKNVAKPFSNKPFVRDLFLGNFDTSVMVYPEFTKTEDLDNLKTILDPIEQFFIQKVDSKTIDETKSIPEEVITGLKDLGLFGQRVTSHIGGMELESKGQARLNEIVGQDGSIATLLTAHNDVALQTILQFGSEEQHERFISDIALGKKTAAYCISEENCGSDIGAIQALALATPDGNAFVLNGTKTWVTNGDNADVFVVFAKGEIENMGDIEQHVSAFIVDRASEGITVGEPVSKVGLNGVSICNVHFKDVHIPAENVIAEIGAGFQMALSVSATSRISEGATVCGILKKLTEQAADHVINRKQFKKHLCEFGLVKDRIARISLMMYVLESMTYLTAGISDNFQYPEIALESAIVKIYATETAWECLKEFVQIFGVRSCLLDHPVQRYLCDSYSGSTIRGTNDMLRLYIALIGVQHAGRELIETIRKTRNPFNNVGFTLKKRFSLIGYNISKPKLIHKVYNHVHPSLSFAAEELETRVHQFQDRIEWCLSAYGKEIVDDQITLKHMADVSIDLYAMTAVLARASRSMSIGLRSGDLEVLMAQLFTREASQRIISRLDHIAEGKYENGDEVKLKIADAVFKAKGYPADHPLERNW